MNKLVQLNLGKHLEYLPAAGLELYTNHLKLGWAVPCWVEFVGTEQGPVGHSVISFPLIHLLVPLSQSPDPFRAGSALSGPVCRQTMPLQYLALRVCVPQQKKQYRAHCFKLQQSIEYSLFRDIYSIMFFSNVSKVFVF